MSLVRAMLPLVRGPLRKLGGRLASDHAIATLREPGSQLVWHVTTPKSGSTWTAKLMSGALAELGWKTASLVAEYGYREQVIDPRNLLIDDCLGCSVFAHHQHCSYSDYAMKFIIQHKAKVIIQVRDVLDSLVSFIDHLDDCAVQPMVFMTADRWRQIERAERERLVVDLVGPWFIRFWAGWTHALKHHDVDFLLVRYEDILPNPQQKYVELFQFCGVETDGDEVDRWMQKYASEGTRKNKAIVGRGQTLPDELIQRVHAFAAYYPDVDFSPVGLGSRPLHLANKTADAGKG